MPLKLRADEQLIRGGDEPPDGWVYADNNIYRRIVRDPIEGAVRRVQAAVSLHMSPLTPPGDTPVVVSLDDARTLLNHIKNELRSDR